MEKQKSAAEIIDSLLQFGWGIFLIILPFIFFTKTSDTFFLPKAIALGFMVVVSLIAIAIKFIILKKINLHQTPLDLPIIISIISFLTSSLFSLNKYDSLIYFFPILFAGLSYFILVNIIRKAESAFFFIASIITSATLLSLLACLQFIHIYPLPNFHNADFSPFGSLLDQAIFLGSTFILSVFFAFPLLQKKTSTRGYVFAVISFIILCGLAVTILKLFTTSKPVILPFFTGFQIAFAAISQDTLRVAQGFFFGSGIGTFFTDFTRFKQVIFNTDNSLWFVNFNQSSSFLLELLATTGIFGVASFLFILIRSLSNSKHKTNNPLFFAIIALFITSALLPFSGITLIIFFIFLSIFASITTLKDANRTWEIEFSLLTLKKSLPSEESSNTIKLSVVMPVIFAIFIAVIISFISYFSFNFLLSDMAFTESIAAANVNNGTKTYQKQIEAINLFPYRDVYYRTFSQTNIAISNSLLTLSASQKSTPSAALQNQVLNLIQQGINAARTATNISPINTINWQNLESVYRSLIGFSKGSENFAIASSQQAIVLDPNNPQEYITLGGLYYQLQQYDNAIREFQIASNLKPDYPNAYYNAGHAYELKGDLENALKQYQTVQSLVINDTNNARKIEQEIAAIQKKLGGQQAQQTKKDNQTTAAPVQEPLTVNQPSPKLVQPSPALSQ